MAAESPLDKLLFDVEDRCNRAVSVIRAVVPLTYECADKEEQPLATAALEMIAQELEALSARALKERCAPKAAA